MKPMKAKNETKKAVHTNVCVPQKIAQKEDRNILLHPADENETSLNQFEQI